MIILSPGDTLDLFQMPLQQDRCLFYMEDKFNHLKPLNIPILFKVPTNLIPSGQQGSSLDFSPYLNKPRIGPELPKLKSIS